MIKTYFREPINAFTHLGGAVCSLIGTIVLLALNSHTTTLGLISILTFGLSLILLYTTSGIYHAVISTDSVILKLKKLDHSMIFILIAGSYTPFALLSLSGAWRISIISIVWGIALIGIFLKIFWIEMPRFLSTALYIGMGWIAIFALKPLYDSLSFGGFLFLSLGGVMYTIGGIIYGLKKPNFSPDFGFHELFHIFCILGSCCHYWAILKYVL